jgi:hypothetical protein
LKRKVLDAHQKAAHFSEYIVIHVGTPRINPKLEIEFFRNSHKPVDTSRLDGLEALIS